MLHFGGISVEAPFDLILQENILGVANLYEAVHKSGIKRVVFASSNHATGYYRTTDMIDAALPVRPDSMYGVSKCFGETLSRYYYDRFGTETVCTRIGSCFPAPTMPRMLTTYLSYDDLVEALYRSLVAPRAGHAILFGVSDNPGKWWDNRQAAHLGFVAKDSSAPFSANFPVAGTYPAPDDVGATFQGGRSCYPVRNIAKAAHAHRTGGTDDMRRWRESGVVRAPRALVSGRYTGAQHLAI